MDREKELRLILLEYCEKNKINVNVSLIPDFKPPDYSDKEVSNCLEYLASEKDIQVKGYLSYEFGTLTEKGEKYLKELKNEKSLETLHGWLSRHWYKGVMLLISIITVIYVILDYYLK